MLNRIAAAACFIVAICSYAAGEVGEAILFVLISMLNLMIAREAE